MNHASIAHSVCHYPMLLHHQHTNPAHKVVCLPPLIHSILFSLLLAGPSACCPFLILLTRLIGSLKFELSQICLSANFSVWDKSTIHYLNDSLYLSAMTGNAKKANQIRTESVIYLDPMINPLLCMCVCVCTQLCEMNDLFMSNSFIHAIPCYGLSRWLQSSIDCHRSIYSS